MSKAIIKTVKGDMHVEFYDADAPNTVKNFRDLAGKGYYNGLTFHRVIPDFVIQGGCPQGTGTGGPGWRVKAEFNKRPHQPGTLSMARSADPDSAGSQFFICLTREQCQHLDGQYTGFGQVTKGMEIVKKIAAVPVDRSGRPTGSLPKMTKVSAPDSAKG